MRSSVVVSAALMIALALVGQASAVPITVTVMSTDVPKDIPDNDPTGITSVLTGPNWVITDIDLIIGELRHDYVSDLNISLKAPSGYQKQLIVNGDDGGILASLFQVTDFFNTTFDDEAVTNLAAGTAPFTGSFNINHPFTVGNDPLATFIGENALGTWTLSISDTVYEDSGQLVHWGIRFTADAPEGPEVIPEPCTLSLLALGGLAALLRRRRA